MYYLSAGNRGLFKSYYCYILFLPFEKSFSDIMKKVFISISVYSWKKIIFLTNIRNKSVVRKINLYFFDFIKNGQIFPSKVCYFQYGHRFLFSRVMGNIRMYKEYVWKNLLKIAGKTSIIFSWYSDSISLLISILSEAKG